MDIGHSLDAGTTLKLVKSVQNCMRATLINPIRIYFVMILECFEVLVRRDWSIRTQNGCRSVYV